MAGNMTRDWITLDFYDECIFIDDIVQNEEKTNKYVNVFTVIMTRF